PRDFTQLPLKYRSSASVKKSSSLVVSLSEAGTTRASGCPDADLCSPAPRPDSSIYDTPNPPQALGLPLPARVQENIHWTARSALGVDRMEAISAEAVEPSPSACARSASSPGGPFSRFLPHVDCEVPVC